MKEEDIFFNNLVLINNEITFSTDDKSKESIVKLLDDVDSEINLTIQILNHMSLIFL